MHISTPFLAASAFAVTLAFGTEAYILYGGDIFNQSDIVFKEVDTTASLCISPIPISFGMANWETQDYSAMAGDMEIYAAGIDEIYGELHSLDDLAQKLQTENPDARIVINTDEETVTAIYTNAAGEIDRASDPAIITVGLEGKTYQEMRMHQGKLDSSGGPSDIRITPSAITQYWYNGDQLSNSENFAFRHYDRTENTMELRAYVNGLAASINGSPSEMSVDLNSGVIFQEVYSKGDGLDARRMHREDNVHYIDRDRETGHVTYVLFRYHDSEMGSNEYIHEVFYDGQTGDYLKDEWQKDDRPFAAPFDFEPPVGQKPAPAMPIKFIPQ